MLESPKFVENNYYDGSRAFTWLADLCGLSVDLINFLICQISALFLASLFRSMLHPSKVSSAVRHTFALTIGLIFGYFCFGRQAIHIAGLPAVCYVVIRTQSPAVVQRNVMLVAMTYLLCIHLIRQIYDYGSYSLDITGPLMIITQKVTSLAFSIHDGFVREHQDLTKAQQYHAVQKIPSALEYFSYVMHFQGIMAGPLVFYKDYIDFVEGYNLLQRPTTNGNLDNGKSHHVVLEPSPTKTVVKKVLSSMVCAFIFMKFVKIYPVKNMKDEDFVENTTILYKLWYASMATTCIRFKYYHAWLLADAICNNSGLGFTGYDKDGNAKWDLISNINVLSFEFATNMRDAINNWNCGTNRWLRTIVYERVPKKYGTVLTFALSAVWHGFYPGYYLTFATGAMFVTSARVARRLLRYRFQRTQFTRMFYDILTCLTTRLVMGYATFPFVLLEFMGSTRLYLKFYMCLHTIALLTIFVLPKFIRGDRRSYSIGSEMSTIKTESTTTITSQTDATTVTANGNDKINKALTNGIVVGNKKNSQEVYQNGATVIVSDDNIPQLNKKDLNGKLSAPLMVTSDETIIKNRAYGSNIRDIPSSTQSVPSSPTTARDAVSVKHDQCEMDQLSSKLKEKFEAETKCFEDFIDKTVTDTVSGIVEFKNDLMRDCKFPSIISPQDGIRKRAAMSSNGITNNNVNNDDITAAVAGKLGDDTSAFLKKEIEVINAVVQQANVLPAVLSNGHAK